MDQPSKKSSADNIEWINKLSDDNFKDGVNPDDNDASMTASDVVEVDEDDDENADICIGMIRKD